VIEILEPGPQTTVQDRGRHGQLRAGIPPSGPMDLHAFVLANRLVGNDAHAAVLECTFAGPRFVVERDCALAVTGADMALTCNGQAVPAWRTLRLQAGDMVKLGAARAGMRSYIAFAGGIDVPGKKIIKGLEEVYKKLIEFKKKQNTPIVVSRDGKIIEINPNQIQPTLPMSKTHK
jgi:allophanate hydrolase subunit 2